jgi:hypothetical protein
VQGQNVMGASSSQPVEPPDDVVRRVPSVTVLRHLSTPSRAPPPRAHQQVEGDC